MNTKKLILSTALAAAMFCASSAGAETLTVGNATAAPGATGVTVPITIDVPGNVAGAAFTITFDDTVFTLTGISSTFFDTFTNQNIEHGTSLPASVNVDGTVYDQPLIATTGTGGVMVAAARITDGATVTTMFTLEFSVDSGATPDDYSIGIVASNINNTYAGYPAGGEDIPILIGHDAGSTPEFPEIVPTIVAGTFTVGSVFTDSDGDGIDDNWEIDHFGNLTTATASSDYDHDGYSDYQEYLNEGTNDPNGTAFDPMVVNAPGGTGSQAINDFNKNGTTDLLWRHTDGWIAQWLMSASGESAAVLGKEPGNYTFQTLGDFNGDGKADVFWRHTAGWGALWLMDGSSKTTASLGLIGTSYSLLGKGDFNGDGKTDLLWRHTDGWVAVWLMNGGSATSVSLGMLSTAYSFEAVGDFNGDGKTDILWSHTDGWRLAWFMNGSTKTASSLGKNPANYTFTAVGDFNADGKTDILWRHTAGWGALWLMNGTSKTTVSLGLIGTAYQYTAVGDFNGDGKEDVLWQHTDGWMALWLMTGTSYTGHSLGKNPSGYSFETVGDFNGDGKTDVLWRHTTGWVASWLMNGASKSTDVYSLINTAYEQKE